MSGDDDAPTADNKGCASLPTLLESAMVSGLDAAMRQAFIARRSLVVDVLCSG